MIVKYLYSTSQNVQFEPQFIILNTILWNWTYYKNKQNF